tara:strand:- start:178 stop:306 length:129 start_codon:yes stop_codon:yes gene_type:complete
MTIQSLTERILTGLLLIAITVMALLICSLPVIGALYLLNALN